MSWNSRKELWTLGGIAALYLCIQIPLWSYITDDTYIHLVYAHNLLLGKGWVFNLGEPSYGSTSPLWVMLLTPIAGSEASGLFAARIFAVLAGLVSIFVFHRLAGRVIEDVRLRFAATLLFATEMWFLRWSGSGMESSLGVLLLLLLLDGLAAAPFKSGAVFRIGLYAGLLSLVRPECYMMDAILVGLALFSTRWRRKLIPLLIGIALPLIPWFLFAQFELGGIMPTTAAAKSRDWQGLGHLLLQTWRLIKIVAMGQGVLLLISGIGVLGVLYAWLRGRLRGAEERGRDGSGIRFYALFAAVWTVALPVVYILKDVQVISRYLLIVTPILPLAACYFMDRWALRRPALIRLVLPLVLLLTVAPNLGYTFVKIIPHSRQFAVDLEAGIGRMADYLRQREAVDISVACPDIGLVGFRSGRRVVDLGGLIHPEIAAHWHTSGYREMIADLEFLQYRKANYLIDRAPVAETLAGAIGDSLFLLPVMNYEVQSLGLRSGEPVNYTLYRIGPQFDRRQTRDP